MHEFATMGLQLARDQMCTGHVCVAPAPTCLIDYKRMKQIAE